MPVTVERVTAAEGRVLLARMPQKQRSKYGARRTTSPDGIAFHSAKEARRWAELQLLERAGEIGRVARQQRFELCVPQTDLRGNVRHRGWWKVIGSYVADFTYDEFSAGTPRFVIEDVKGFKTSLYQWKKKHVEAQYGIVIRET